MLLTKLKGLFMESDEDAMGAITCDQALNQG